MPVQLRWQFGNAIVGGVFACHSQDGYNESVGHLCDGLQWKAMGNPLRVCRFALGILITVTGTSLPAWAGDHAGSKTVVGESNSLLADGAAALEAGRVEEGVRLTLEGLKIAVTVRESAAGHSNACAGYVLLQQWTEALAQCNAALELDKSNWRTYNNRAAIYVKKGLYDLAMHDLDAGLALAPGAATLQESVRILQRNRRLLSRQTRKAVAS